MPGNEFGDKVHNFFSQENLSQGQHQLQADRSWPGLSNNLWVGSQTQIGGPSNSVLKNHNLEQSDSGRAPGGQSSSLRHGLSFGQFSPSHEFSGSQSQKLPISNGYVHGHQVSDARRNEANFMRVDTESDQHNLTPTSQLGNGPQLDGKNYLRLEHPESPVNYDFFGGPQQMRGQHANLLPRQQSGSSDMQLLEHQVMLKRTHELQRQQQLQEHETRQMASVNQMSSMSRQAAGNHSIAQINGIPFHPISDNPWQPDMMTSNSSWLQNNTPTVMQASSSEAMFSSDQGQALYNRGLVPQQLDQSLYGVPISSTRGTQNQYPHIQLDKTSMQHISASSNSLPGDQFVAFPDLVNMQDGQFVSRQLSQGRNTFGPSAAQDLSSGSHLENMQQLNQKEFGGPVHQAYGGDDIPCSSGTLQEKSMTQVGPSQTVATLDPTEEKILFGSDDNLWDAFSKGTGGYNVLDGNDISSSFLSSGTWSALMQSAVAEASSDDIRPQEEWNSWNPQPPRGNQHPSIINDSSKQQLVSADKNFQTDHTYSSQPIPFSDDANSGIKYGRYLETPQNDQQQIDSSLRISQQFSEGSKQFQFQEGGHSSGNISKSSDAELNEKISSVPWSHHRNNRSNGWNFIESTLPSGRVSSLKNHHNENPLEPSRTINYKRAMHAELDHGTDMWNTNSLPTSTGMGNIKASIGSPMINREYTNLNNLSTVANRERITNNQSLDFWKHVNSSVNSKGSGVSGQPQHHMDDGPRKFQLPGHNGSVKGAGELDKSNKNEKMSESFCASVSPGTSAGGLQENVWFDASDPRAGRKQKSYGNVVQRSNTRKFQYHPMGDVEADPESSYGTRNVAHLQTMPHQASQGFMPKFADPLDRNSLEMDKGRIPSFQGSNPSALFDRSVGNYAPSKTVPSSSQNMLELIHKVDQSRESGAGTRHSSSDQNPSVEMPEAETSDGSFSHLQQNPSSASECFGLQLAPPSQRFPILDHNSCSLSTAHTIHSLGLRKPTHGIGDKGITWLVPQDTAQSSSFRETHRGESRNNVSSTSEEPINKSSQSSSLGTFPSSISGFPYSRGHVQNQHIFGTRGQVARSQSVGMPSDMFASHSKLMEYSRQGAVSSQSVLVSVPGMSGTPPYNDHVSSAEASQLNKSNQNRARDSARHISEFEGVPASNSSVPTGMLQQAVFPKQLPSLCTSNVLSEQPNKGDSGLQSNSHTETIFTGEKKPEYKMANEGNNPSEFAAGSKNSQSIVGEMRNSKESMWTNESLGNSLAQQETSGCTNATLPNNVDTQRDVETFGRSLKLHKNLHQSYSLLQQVQAMKDTETDPSNRNIKRIKGPDCSPHVFSGEQQISEGKGQFIQSGDSHSQNASAFPQDMFKFAPSDPQNRKLAPSAVGEHSNISTRMAPSWFDHSGALTSAQVLQTHDSRNSAAVQTVEHPSIAGRNSGDLNDRNFVMQVNSSSKANQLCAAQKSTAETEWALAAKRLVEKVIDEVEMIEDGPPRQISKRRLIMTTQLTEQLLRPPPQAVLSLPARSQYESVTYFVARLGLRDACSSVSRSRSDPLVPSDKENIQPDNCEESEKNCNPYLKATEDFVDRARKLENEFLRLEKSSSILDLRIESQDLEKFSVINRFARFHGRAQTDGAENSSSDATGSSWGFHPQRYVTAFPMSRNLPDRVQCLQL